MSLPAVILAGGRSRRMGGVDKAFLSLGGARLIDRVIARLTPQCAPLAINANGDPARFGGLGLPVLTDPIPGFPGPVTGILAAMDWAATLGASHVLTVPVDCPFLPPDLASRLQAAGQAAIAQSATGVHPVVGYWPVGTAPALKRALEGGERRVRSAAELAGARAVKFDGAPDPFLNINSPDDLAAAEALL